MYVDLSSILQRFSSVHLNLRKLCSFIILCPCYKGINYCSFNWLCSESVSWIIRDHREEHMHTQNMHASETYVHYCHRYDRNKDEQGLFTTQVLSTMTKACS